MTFGRRRPPRAAEVPPLDDHSPPLGQESVAAWLGIGVAGGVLLPLTGFLVWYSLGIGQPPARPFVSRVAYCSEGWQDGFPNGRQLSCFLRHDVFRLCNPRERRHLAAVFDRYAHDATLYVFSVRYKALQPDEAETKRQEAVEERARREGRPLTPDEIGPSAFQYMSEDWAQSPQVRAMGERYVEGARNRLGREDMVGSLQLLLSRGLMTPEEFGETTQAFFGDAIREAARRVKRVTPSCPPRG